jgi:hypothetical protein
VDMWISFQLIQRNRVRPEEKVRALSSLWKIFDDKVNRISDSPPTESPFEDDASVTAAVTGSRAYEQHRGQAVHGYQAGWPEGAL